MTKSFDVFLSHNSRDKPAVRELAEALRARGLDVWLDEWELVPGRPWQRFLEEVTETTQSAAVLVGKDGIGPWQDAEMRGCLAEFVRRQLPVIPVLLPGVPVEPRLPLFLAQMTWVELRDGLTGEGLDRIQWGVTGKRPDRSKPLAAVAPTGSTSSEVGALPLGVDSPTDQRRALLPAGWIALATLSVIVIAALIFGIVRRIPVTVDATGILLRGGTVEANASGVVEKIDVQEGALVEKGSVVAHLKLSDLELEIQTVEERVRGLQGRQRLWSSRFAALKSSYRKQLSNFNQRRTNIEALIQKQIKTRSDLAEIDSQISKVKTLIRHAEEEETLQGGQLEEGQRKLQLLKERKENGGIVRTNQSGRIAAILKQEGQSVKAGETLLTIDGPKAPVQVLLFVSISEARKVLRGQTVRISPTTVRREVYGFMLGTVETVSSQPVTQVEVRATLQNDQLAQRLALDTPFRVKAMPTLNAGEFVWNPSGGPPYAIMTNTPCTAQIVIGERSLISYVIPAVKKGLVTY